MDNKNKQEEQERESKHKITQVIKRAIFNPCFLRSTLFLGACGVGLGFISRNKSQLKKQNIQMLLNHPQVLFTGFSLALLSSLTLLYNRDHVKYSEDGSQEIKLSKLAITKYSSVLFITSVLLLFYPFQFGYELVAMEYLILSFFKRIAIIKVAEHDEEVKKKLAKDAEEEAKKKVAIIDEEIKKAMAIKEEVIQVCNEKVRHNSSFKYKKYMHEKIMEAKSKTQIKVGEVVARKILQEAYNLACDKLQEIDFMIESDPLNNYRS